MTDRVHSNSFGNEGANQSLLIVGLDVPPVLSLTSQRRVSTCLGKVAVLFVSRFTWREF